jgi:hypothetical protein
MHNNTLDMVQCARPISLIPKLDLSLSQHFGLPRLSCSSFRSRLTGVEDRLSQFLLDAFITNKFDILISDDSVNDRVKRILVDILVDVLVDMLVNILFDILVDIFVDTLVDILVGILVDT